MLHTLTRNLLTGILIFASVTLYAFAADSTGRITTEITPTNIHANEPFKLSFFYTSGDMFDRAPTDLKIAIPACFKIINGPRKKVTNTTVNKKNSMTITWDYTLVPLQTGNLLIEPFSFTAVNNKAFRSDTFWVRVADSRISAEDSVQAQQNAYNSKPDNTYSFADPFFNTDGFTQKEREHKSDGVHFNHDSIYTVYVGNPVSVEYSLTFVNVAGMSSDALKAVHIKKLPYVKKLKIVSANNLSQGYYSTKGYIEYTLHYAITFQPTRAGEFTIPPLTFVALSKEYVLPKVKVQVFYD